MYPAGYEIVLQKYEKILIILCSTNKKFNHSFLDLMFIRILFAIFNLLIL